jgi:hypothetical protein
MRWKQDYREYKAREIEENTRLRKKERAKGLLNALAVNGIRVKEGRK